jgi:hypothetical protein
VRFSCAASFACCRQLQSAITMKEHFPKATMDSLLALLKKKLQSYFDSHFDCSGPLSEKTLLIIR